MTVTLPVMRPSRLITGHGALGDQYCHELHMSQECIMPPLLTIGFIGERINDGLISPPPLWGCDATQIVTNVTNVLSGPVADCALCHSTPRVAA